MKIYLIPFLFSALQVFAVEVDKTPVASIPLGSVFNIWKPLLPLNCDFKEDKYFLGKDGKLLCTEAMIYLKDQCSFSYKAKASVTKMNCTLVKNELVAENGGVNLLTFKEEVCPVIACHKGMVTRADFNASDLKSILGNYGNFNYSQTTSPANVNTSGRDVVKDHNEGYSQGEKPEEHKVLKK